MYGKLFFCLFLLIFLSYDLYSKENINFLHNTSIDKNKKEKKTPEERLGIKVESLRLTAYGKMVDFRFRVLDEKKASIVFNPKIKPYLVDSATGYKHHIPNTPKVGSLRSYGTPAKNRVYFMLFGNNGTLKKGSVINIVIGDTTIEKLVIE